VFIFIFFFSFRFSSCRFLHYFNRNAIDNAISKPHFQKKGYARIDISFTLFDIL